MGKDKKDKDEKKKAEKLAKAEKKAREKAEKKAKEKARADKKAREKAKQKKADKQAKAKVTNTAALEELDLEVPAGVTGSFREALRAPSGTDLAAIDTSSTPAYEGDKAASVGLLEELAEEVSDLQERLYAESKGGGDRSLLLVIQGMDTSGKGGIMRHVVGAMDPQGVALTSFKQPTAEEKKHPFLWRIRNALPEAGQIGVFDRSHYEDVLVVRVHDLVPRAQWARRYGQINTFEKGLVDKGTTVIKVMLHVSKDEQRSRLAERLARPDKHWKFNPGDLDERRFWEDYQEAYQVAIDRCSTDAAPWFVVPADKKWYARLAVMNLVREHLAEMDPQWPKADFDVVEQQARLEAEGTEEAADAEE